MSYVDAGRPSCLFASPHSPHPRGEDNDKAVSGEDAPRFSQQRVNWWVRLGQSVSRRGSAPDRDHLDKLALREEVKEDSPVSNSASPSCGLVLQPRDVSAKGIFSHRIEGCDDSLAIFLRHPIKLFFYWSSDVQIPGHVGVDPGLHSRRASSPSDPVGSLEVQPVKR